MTSKRIIGVPTAEAVEDIWQRQATAAAIAAARGVIDGDAIPRATPIGRLTDLEIGWLVTAGLFGWIRCRAEQATAEGWDTEMALRLTGLAPEPWDAGAVTHILSKLADVKGIDWNKSVGSWSKETITLLILEAMKLTSAAMVARDVGGGGITKRKAHERLQSLGNPEAGGTLAMPGELDDDLPFDL
jgi:hypothetical protein